MAVVELPPEYLKALASQIGFVSAFLGGVSATFLATLLTLDNPGRALRWTMGFAGIAAISFFLSAFLSTFVFTTNHEAAPDFISSQDSTFERLGMGLGFVIGVYALLGAVGLSGWHRSKALGRLLFAAAILAAIPTTVALLNA